MRKALKPFAFLAAIAPAFFPREADAETVISTVTTAPVLTSTAGDDLRVSSSGQVNVAAGTAVTVDSNDNFLNEGQVSVVDANGSTSVSLVGGNTGNFTNNATITNLENYTYVDSDSDGDADGAFALGSNRFGVRVSGGSPFVGNLTQGASGILQVEGNTSAALAIDGALTGNVSTAGTISVIGDNSFAVRSTAPITGDVVLGGTITAQGLNSVAVGLDGDVSGQVRIQGNVSANGYRVTSRPSDAAVAAADGDDLLQSGSAVWVSGNVGAGVFVNAAPVTSSTTDTDVDDDGIADAGETSAIVQAYGSSPAVRIGDSGGPAITVGNVGTMTNYTYGLVNDSSIGAISVYDAVSATGVRIENANLTGGLRNAGSILAGSFDQQGTGVSIGLGAVVAEINNAGSITGLTDSDLAPFDAYGVRVEAGANAPILRNSGAIIGRLQGETADAIAIADLSDTLHLIENTGAITAYHTATDDALDTDDADNDASNEVVTGGDIAIDLSSQTIGSIVRQLAPGGASTVVPTIGGDIRFGSGADTLDVQTGNVFGDVSFGLGADLLQITGGTVEGNLSDAGNDVALSVAGGRLNLSNLSAFNATSLQLGANGVVELQLDPLAATNGQLVLSGNANFDPTSSIVVNLQTPVVTSQTFTLLTAGSITGSANVDLSQAPFLYAIATTGLGLSDATHIRMNLTRKTGAQLGMNANQAAMYEPFFTAALGDASLMQTILGLGTSQSFTDAYNQLLPNATGAQTEFAATRSQALHSMLFSRYLGPVQKNREIYAWAHELSYSRDREETATGQGFEGFGFGFAAGIDGPMGDSGYKGFGLSFTSDEIDEMAGADRPMTISSFELMGHLVQPMGGLVVGGRLGAGYDRYKSDRRVVIVPDLNAPSISRQAEAQWSGAHVAASLRAAYPIQAGIFRVRPEAGIDAVSLWEQDYEEEGGGAGIDLAVDSRQSTRANASATVSAGLHLQRGNFLFNPEIMVGARTPLVNEGYSTNAHFVSSPGDFALVGDTVDKTALIAGAALSVDGQIGSLRLEAQAEEADGDTSISGRLVLRLTF